MDESVQGEGCPHKQEWRTEVEIAGHAVERCMACGTMTDHNMREELEPQGVEHYVRNWSGITAHSFCDAITAFDTVKSAQLVANSTGQEQVIHLHPFGGLCHTECKIVGPDPVGVRASGGLARKQVFDGLD